MFDPEKFANAENWFNYQSFYKMIASKNFRVFAEVGVWKGHSISFLANLLRGRDKLEIYAIDLFDDTYMLEHYNLLGSEQQGHLYEIYNYNLEKTNTRHLIKDIKALSFEAAAGFPDSYFDFVFIDADHSYEAVKKDINAWLPKVKKGGIISGHDYKQDFYPGVTKAVNELFSNGVNQFPYDSGDQFCWYVEKK